MTNREWILSGLEQAVANGRREEAITFAKEAISNGIKPKDAIEHGLIKGIAIVGENYSAHKAFLPQMLLSAHALYGALDLLLPLIGKDDNTKKAEVVFGVVEGDVHDIGKNIVKTFFTASGFIVHDIGKDQPAEAFVEAVLEHRAQIVALSTLMTPTMENMKAAVDALTEEGLRRNVKIIIGGAPTSQEFAKDIGADLYAINAQEGVARIKQVV